MRTADCDVATQQRQHQRHAAQLVERRGRHRRQWRNRHRQQHQQSAHEHVRAVPNHARHRAAVLREAFRIDQRVHGQAVASVAAADALRHRGASHEEGGEVAFRMPDSGTALLVFEDVLHDADEESEDVDPFDVSGLSDTQLCEFSSA